jgi:cation:H+ antiporter
LLLLTGGAEILVRGASRLAITVGITPLIVGLTVVAFGTSSPELAVSVMAAWSGPTGMDIALGNVIGSNIFNVFFILGLSALVAPLVVSMQLVRLDVPVMIAVSVLAILLSLDGNISRMNGLILFIGVIIYTVFVIRLGRKQPLHDQSEYFEPPHQLFNRHRQFILDVILIVAGLGCLVAGSHLLVEGAIDIARSFGISEFIISVTIVAAGTSLPEVATSVIASIRGERDIAVGNIVGSNIFNILAVLGLSTLVSPAGINVPVTTLHFDMLVMLAAAFICLPVFFTGFEVTRIEGAILLTYYIIYTSYIILAANAWKYTPLFSMVIIYFIIPMTVLALVIMVNHQIKNRQK